MLRKLILVLGATALALTIAIPASASHAKPAKPAKPATPATATTSLPEKVF